MLSCCSSFAAASSVGNRLRVHTYSGCSLHPSSVSACYRVQPPSGVLPSQLGPCSRSMRCVPVGTTRYLPIVDRPKTHPSRIHRLSHVLSSLKLTTCPCALGIPPLLASLRAMNGLDNHLACGSSTRRLHVLHALLVDHFDRSGFTQSTPRNTTAFARRLLRCITTSTIQSGFSLSHCSGGTSAALVSHDPLRAHPRLVPVHNGLPECAVTVQICHFARLAHAPILSIYIRNVAEAMNVERTRLISAGCCNDPTLVAAQWSRQPMSSCSQGDRLPQCARTVFPTSLCALAISHTTPHTPTVTRPA
ncbi:hypothetical protein C8T65DRAFT_126346 [Cerioporus squamosus]|nr:hypothetical protein C8T65DRAFT_126346 [Cerioporus squamosus]